MNAWLILDSNYLCWRAHHSTGDLSYGDVKTGVAYGYLRALLTLKDQFGPGVRFLHCFDHGPYIRKRICPTYKAHRKPVTLEQEELLGEVRRQIDDLRDGLLPELGFRNVFHARGYEADDMVAEALGGTRGRTAVVSADKDLYQFINPTTIIHDPRTGNSMNVSRFSLTYGIENPESQWPLVRALAGCRTDGVPGIVGVGEKTACRYVAGLLPSRSRAYKLCANHLNAETGEMSEWLDVNLSLVRLPLHGCPSFDVRRDKLTPGRWRRVCRRLGIKTLAEQFIGA